MVFNGMWIQGVLFVCLGGVVIFCLFVSSFTSLYHLGCALFDYRKGSEVIQKEDSFVYLYRCMEGLVFLGWATAAIVIS